MFRSYAIFALLGAASPAVAQQCPDPVGWDAPERHAAARAPDFRFALKPDTAHQLQLYPQTSVKLAVAPPVPAKRGSFAGLAALDVARSGTLDVLLSDRAYVDLISRGKALKSVAHGHLACNGIDKYVTFDVAPGRHIVQLTGGEAKSVRLATISHAVGAKRK